MLTLIRIVHSILSIYFLGSIVYIYYCAITRTNNNVLLFIIGSLLVEGLVIALNKWECPLTPLHNRYGDNKGFFGLFMPQWTLPYVFPVLFALSILGFGLVYFRVF